jgi:hypothetical protein
VYDEDVSQRNLREGLCQGDGVWVGVGR